MPKESCTGRAEKAHANYRDFVVLSWRHRRLSAASRHSFTRFKHREQLFFAQDGEPELLRFGELRSRLFARHNKIRPLRDRANDLPARFLNQRLRLGSFQRRECARQDEALPRHALDESTLDLLRLKVHARVREPGDHLEHPRMPERAKDLIGRLRREPLDESALSRFRANLPHGLFIFIEISRCKFKERIHRAKGPCERGGHRHAKMADREPDEHSREPPLFRSFERPDKILGALFSEALKPRELLRFERIELMRRIDAKLFNELIDERGAETVDIHRAPARKMCEPLADLLRA